MAHTLLVCVGRCGAGLIRCETAHGVVLAGLSWGY